MPKQLTPQTATITTATVEVKAIKISGKQVTIAVYQQLRSEPLVSHEGTLNGVPWGYVNRCSNACDGEPHWHVVWQRGTDLLRSTVTKEAPRGTHSAKALDRYLTAAVREYLHGRTTGLEGEVPLEETNDRRITIDGRLLPKWEFNHAAATAMADERTFSNSASKPPFNWTAKVPATAVVAMSLSEKHLRCHGFHSDREALVAVGKRALARLDEMVDEWGLSFSEISRSLRVELEAESERRRRHTELRKTLAELPQLFIAV